MREIARIWMKIREHTSDQTDTLKSVLCPKKFDEVIQAIQAECKYVVSENNTTFDIPSLALKIGHTLRRCCYIKMSVCIKEKDKLGENEVEQLDLMKVTGKRGRSVPVILAEDDVAALKILVDMNVQVRGRNNRNKCISLSKWERQH
ncbi:hypothetical protein KUTeg_009882 [Tegillarca granosa]|uniref:Uncharacterized protein n=1 Tax=Tegillarca granosa TaxID=220873 RepID=A0ABQ9F5A4_TEGGR|nr:hypothetical protein KUTeg_009882 [Tegillarca granosa]